MSAEREPPDLESSLASAGQLALRELLPALQRLDALLERAAARVPEVYGAHVVGDRYRGLYISETDVAQALACEPAAPRLAFASGDLPGAAFDGGQWTGSRLAWLADTYSLSPFEVDVLIMALAPEIDLRYERLYGYLQDDVTKRRPTVDLALNVLCASAAERLERRRHFAADAPLSRHRLIDVVAESNGHHPTLLAQALVVDAQIVRFLVDERSLDRRLASFCRVDEEAASLLGPSDDAALFGAVALARRAQADDRGLCIHLHGSPGSGRRRFAASLAGALGAPLLTADVARIWDNPEFEPLVATAMRDAWFRGAVIHLRCTDPLLDDAQLARREWLKAELAAANDGTIVIVSSAHLWPMASRAGALTITLGVPEVERREELWRAHLDAAPIASAPSCDAALPALASRFKLTAHQIGAAVRHASMQTAARNVADSTNANGSALDADDLFASARELSGRALATLASRLEPMQRWDELVLPDDALDQLREMCDRVAWQHRVLHAWGFGARMSRGRGTSALFSGPSGTGKTMAAEVMARELGVDLYRVDLAGVVSKYIGETEKNLDRIFDAAEASNGIVFFDEADALFGKRSEVHDSHDRYANIEISYLLQKMEQYEGIAILATNLRANMDDAFLRRLAFVVHFPFPDEASRRRIWRVVWPVELPLADDVDIDFLARQFKLSGGNIRNVGLAAAYLAAEGGAEGPVTMAHVLRATRREYQKMGKQLSAADFAPYALEGAA
jgi:hypothetical protein